MKIIKFFSLFLSIAMMLFSGCMATQTNELSSAEKAVLKIESKIGQKLIKKYKMKVIGDYAQMPGGVINNFGLLFEVYRVLSREQAREILVDGVQEFLTEINSNEEIRPFLKNYPFTPQNITLDIYIKGPGNQEVFDPDIRVASITNGKLCYSTKDKKKKYGYKSEYKESFEEAVKLVQEAHTKSQK